MNDESSNCLKEKKRKIRYCVNCREKEKKYTCPTCLFPICSLPCFKVHSCRDKSQDHQKEEKEKEEESSSDLKLKNRESTIYIEQEEDRIPEEKLSLLKESCLLRDLLKNPHLRRYLSKINTTHNPRGFMKCAMQEPIFVEFADEVLKVLHPELRQDTLTDQQITEAFKKAISPDDEDH